MRKLLFLLGIFFSLIITNVIFAQNTPTEFIENINITPDNKSSYDPDKVRPIEGSSKEDVDSDMKEHTQAISDQRLGKGVYLEGMNDNIIMATLNSSYCRLAGGNSCLIETADGTTYNPYGPSVAQGMSKLIAYTFTPPASGVQYLASVFNNFGLTKTYAQGAGYASLNPILPLWRLFRNVSYIFFTIFALVIGFMILFRQKIDSQTSVNIQQAIPSILIALILVTFSYAISGLMIDLMYFSMYFFASFFTGIDSSYMTMGIFGLTAELIAGGWGNSNQLINSLVENSFNSFFTNGLVSFISSLTLAVIVSVVVVFGAFKLFINLLKAYISVLISMIFSPLMLMMHSIPGKKPLGTWAKSILSNLACFPLVFILLVIYKQITSSDGFSADGGFMPPYLLATGNMNSEAIKAVLGLAIIMTLPDIIEQIRKKFGGDQSFFAQFGDIAMQNLKTGAKKGGGLPLTASGAALGGLGGAGLGAGVAAVKAGYGAMKGHGMNGEEFRNSIKSGMRKGSAIGAGTFARGASKLGSSSGFGNEIPVFNKLAENFSHINDKKWREDKELQAKKRERELLENNITSRQSGINNPPE